MGKKQLVKNLIIDLLDHDHNLWEGDVAAFRDHGQWDGAKYKRFSRKVERWDFGIRTHVFHIKIPAHKWRGFVAEVADEQGDHWLSRSIELDRQASSHTWQEYVDGRDYTADEIEEIKQAFNELKIFSQNHSVTETLEERERLGLIT